MTEREQEILLADAVRVLWQAGKYEQARAVYRLDPSALHPEITLVEFKQLMEQQKCPRCERLEATVDCLTPCSGKINDAR